MFLKTKKVLLLLLVSITILSAAKNRGKMIEGVLITNSMVNAKMRITSTGPRPKVGEKGELQKYFQRTIMSGWLGKGTIKVTAIKGNILSFKVLKEESIMRMNGAKINHFTKGTKVQIFWGAPKKATAVKSTPKKNSATPTVTTTTAVSRVSSFPKAISSRKKGMTEHPIFAPQWKVYNTGWSDDMVVSNDGWVVAFGRSYIHYHEAGSGATTNRIHFASVVDGGAKINGPKSVLAISGYSKNAKIWNITVPNCTKKLEATITGVRPSFASYGENSVAIGGKNGTVVVYNLQTKQELSRIKLNAPISSLALSPNEKIVAIGTDSSQLYIHDVGTQKTALFKNTQRHPDALSFSPDGSKLFCRSASFLATIYSAKDGTIISTHKTGSWLVESQWISHKEILASGSDGLLLYTVGIKSGQKLKDPKGQLLKRSFEGIGISPNGRYLCAGDRDGVVVKFGTK